MVELVGVSHGDEGVGSRFVNPESVLFELFIFVFFRSLTMSHGGAWCRGGVCGCLRRRYLGLCLFGMSPGGIERGMWGGGPCVYLWWSPVGWRPLCW